MAKPGGVRLDRIDLKIFSVLERDGRITKLALADAVGLSPTPCWNRLKRLEQAGVIEGYRAVIAPEFRGAATSVWVEVVLRNHRREDFARFEAAIERLDAVAECWAVGGGVDYFLKVETDGIEAYQALIDRLLAEDCGIERYYSYVVTKPVKRRAVSALDAPSEP